MLVVLGIDTSTPATAVALAGGGGEPREARDDPEAGARPRHAERVLTLAQELLTAAAIGWDALDAVAVGVGPGGYTGLRIGLASARGLALSLGAGLLGVGTLRALGEPVRGRAAATILDARRGEAFVGVYRDGEELLAPLVCDPAELVRWARHGGADVLAVGDGALRFRAVLEADGVEVAPGQCDLHRVSAAAVCRLAAIGTVTAPVPDYLRLADAERAQDHRTT